MGIIKYRVFLVVMGLLLGQVAAAEEQWLGAFLVADRADPFFNRMTDFQAQPIGIAPNRWISEFGGRIIAVTKGRRSLIVSTEVKDGVREIELALPNDSSVTYLLGRIQIKQKSSPYLLASKEAIQDGRVSYEDVYIRDPGLQRFVPVAEHLKSIRILPRQHRPSPSFWASCKKMLGIGPTIGTQISRGHF